MEELVLVNDFVFTTNNMLGMDSVFIYKGQKYTTSWIIAKDFGKEHKSILRIIQSFITDLGEEIDRHNFAPVSYLGKNNESRPMYLLDKVGFEMIVLSFTGKEHTKTKYEYVKKFNAMEANHELLTNDPILAIRISQLKAEKRLDLIEAQIDQDVNHFTKMSRKMGVNIVKTKDEKYGEVNIYRSDIIDVVFKLFTRKDNKLN